MKLKVFLSVIFSVLVVAGSTFALTMTGTPEEFKQLAEKEANLGAIPGTDVYNDMTFYGNNTFSGTNTFTGANSYSGAVSVAGDVTTDKLFQGGGVYTYSSTTALTLTDDTLCDYNYLSIQPIGGNQNLTLPATSTITACLTSAGDSMKVIVENSATTTNNLTFVAGAGMDLQENDGQNVVIGQNNFAVLEFWKRSDTDIVVVVNETIPAD